MAARGEGAVDKWWRGNEISGVLEPRQGEWYKVRTQLPIPNTYLLRQKKRRGGGEVENGRTL